MYLHIGNHYYVRKQDMLVPDWDATIEKLHNTIYGE